jgi:protein TonB
MPSSPAARIVYLDEVRAPAVPPRPHLSGAGTAQRRRIAVWLVVSLALHALVLALPIPWRASLETPPALQTLDVIIVAERAPPAAAPTSDRASELPAAPPARVARKAAPAPAVERSPKPPPERAVESQPAPATEARAIQPPIAEPRRPSAAEAAPPREGEPTRAPRVDAATAALQAPAVPAAPLTPPSFGAAYLDNPPPVYPLSARRLGQSGLVVLQVRVSEAGKPVEVRVTKSAGVEALDRAALDAVRGWSFVPARQGETPVAAWVEVPIRFRLADSR